jgi:hypothetical protein
MAAREGTCMALRPPRRARSSQTAPRPPRSTDPTYTSSPRCCCTARACRRARPIVRRDPGCAAEGTLRSADGAGLMRRPIVLLRRRRRQRRRCRRQSRRRPRRRRSALGLNCMSTFWFDWRIRVRIRSEQSWACRNARLCTDVSIQKTPRKLTYHCS